MKIFRIIVFIAVLLGIVGLAENQVAWAAVSAEQSGQTVAQEVGNSVSAYNDNFCSKPWNRHSKRCREREKEHCKKHKEDCRSVKPPHWNTLIPVTGEYSVGGFSTLSVTLNEPEFQLDARLMNPLQVNLPRNVQKVRQGVLLTYYHSKKRIESVPTNSGSITICFAAQPGKQMTIYFYNIYSAKPKWAALETTTDLGKACAKGSASGVYIVTFQQH
jgi:hypothetical protein